MIPQLIALDIDGTLLAPGVLPDARPDPETTQLIAQLMEAGVAVALATGRMYPGTERIARHLGVRLPLICQQGAATHELNGRIKQEFCIDPGIAAELVAYAQANNWPYAWFDSERYLVSDPNEQCQQFAAVSGIPVEFVDAPHTSGVRATGVDIISSQTHASAIHAQLAHAHGEAVQLVNFPSVTAAYSPLATKGYAVRQLASELSIPQAAVLAIGDGVNDVSMLKWAGLSAAPEHADAYARDAADELLPGKGVAGVARRLRAVLAQL